MKIGNGMDTQSYHMYWVISVYQHKCQSRDSICCRPLMFEIYFVPTHTSCVLMVCYFILYK